MSDELRRADEAYSLAVSHAASLVGCAGETAAWFAARQAREALSQVRAQVVDQ